LEGLLPTAGERLAIWCPQGWIARQVAEGADGCFIPGPPDSPTVRVRVEPGQAAFPVAGWARLARDAWSRDGHVVIRDVVTSGFDLHAWVSGPVPDLVLRWRPPKRTRAAGLLLRERARMAIRAAILQYPALWAASIHGRAPLHAAALTAGSRGPALLVGPSGTGKTTLVMTEATAGGAAIGDNLAVGDGRRVWGMVEPVRSDQGPGRRSTHGRRTTHLPGRVDALDPAVVVILARGTGYRIEACDPETATRALVASTYAAGELRRYWGVQALLALGTGAYPPHPRVGETAATFTSHLPCLWVELPRARGERLAEHLALEGTAAWT
jgi:hypothetical protein